MEGRKKSLRDGSKGKEKEGTYTSLRISSRIGWWRGEGERARKYLKLEGIRRLHLLSLKGPRYGPLSLCMVQTTDFYSPKWKTNERRKEERKWECLYPLRTYSFSLSSSSLSLSSSPRLNSRANRSR